MKQQDDPTLWSDGAERKGHMNLDADERTELGILNGFRLKQYGDRTATHAICKHGEIVPADADSHTCSWTRLVAFNEKRP